MRDCLVLTPIPANALRLDFYSTLVQRSRTMLIFPALNLLAVCSVSIASPDEVEIQLGLPTTVLVQAEGGSTSAESTFYFDSSAPGTLYVQVRSSELDPNLVIELPRGETIEDDNSGGGTTSFAFCQTAEDQRFHFRVQSSDGVPGEAVLLAKWVRKTSELEDGLKEVDALREALAEYSASDQVEEMEECIDAIMDVLSTIEDPDHEVGYAAYRVGVMAMKGGFLDDSLRSFRIAVDIFDDLQPEEHPYTLEAHVLLGNALTDHGDLDSGLQEIIHVLRVRKATHGEKSLKTLNARIHLGRAFEVCGRLEEARDELQIAVNELSLVSGGEAYLTMAQGNLALVVKELGDLDLSRILEEQVYESFLASYPEDHLYVQMARVNLGGTLGQLGEYEEAEILLRAGFGELSHLFPSDHPMVQQARQDLAGCLTSMGNLSEARDMLIKVVETWEGKLPDDHVYLQKARMNLSTVLVSLGEVAAGIQFIETVLEQYEHTLPRGHSALSGARVQCLGALMASDDSERAAEVAMDLIQDTKYVIENIGLTMSMREAGTALMETQRAINVLARYAGKVEQPRIEQELLSLIESARSVGSTTSRLFRLASQGSGDSDIQVAITSLQQASAKVASTAMTDQVALGRAVLDRDKSERGLRDALRGAVSVTPPSPEEALAILGSEEAILAFHEYKRLDLETGGYRPMLLVHVLRDEEVELHFLGPLAPIEEAVARWRRELGVGSTMRGEGVREPLRETGGQDSGAQLVDLLIAPILEDLDGITRIHVLADGPIHKVPFDALPFEKGYLGERFEVIHQPSLIDLVASHAIFDGQGGALLVGDIDYGSPGPGGDFLLLPGAAAEIRAIANLYSGAGDLGGGLKSLAGLDATRTELFARAPGARYLHVATHGWATSDSDRPADALAPMLLCGLALTGANRGGTEGAVTAEDIAMLDLSDCELAVLSACETRLGRENEAAVHSLQTALHVAGARSSITSLWRVDDLATQLLMAEFYRLLWEKGFSKAAALRSAKRWLRTMTSEDLTNQIDKLGLKTAPNGAPALSAEQDELPFASPRYWAAWVLTGSTD
ncbi:MAG: CHAT domain-containing protein/tetratricopeptide (TPR) repeat protein [Planctomycetota bacterium]|jgi:CHAT domain-containing protein/tetratricopeptide (TPR) repeat protein